MNNVTFQIWNKLDTAGMSAELAAKYKKKDGTDPEFLVVSQLESLEDAQQVLEQERMSGWIYWIKEVAA